MTTLLEIPLIASPQKLTISLNSVVYSLSLKWNTFLDCWVMDFGLQDGTPILSGVPMVPNVDLFEQYEYLDFGGVLVAANETDDDPPTFTNLGDTGHLYFITP